MMKLSQKPNHALLGYSAIAAAFLATTAELSAQTATLYYDYSPDSLVLSQPFGYSAIIDVDLLRNGVPDAWMYFEEHSSWYGSGGTSRTVDKIFPFTSKLEIVGYPGSGFGNMASALSYGETVDSLRSWQTGSLNLRLRYVSYSGVWYDGGWDNYAISSLGLRYQISPGNYIYGWMRLQLRTGSEMAILYDIMWNFVPNAPITVGAAPPSGGCERPTALNATVLSPTKATLSWVADPTAIGNHLEGKKATSSEFGRVVEGSSSRTFTTLSPGTNYNWRVRSICSSGLVSPATAISTFSTPTLAKADRNEQQDEQPVDFNVRTYTDHGRLVIESDQTIESYKLYNAAGAMLQSGAVSAQQLVASTNYPAGIYLVEVIIDGQAIWSKFHVE